MQMSVFPNVPIWVTRKYSLRQLNNIYCILNSLTTICTLVVLVAPLLQVPSQSPSTGTCEDDTGLPWKQDDKMTRWQDDKMTTQDCPGNKACDPFALKFMSYCCSYISIDWLTDIENLLPTLNHTFKSWSRDFSWWRKNYCFFCWTCSSIHSHFQTVFPSGLQCLFSSTQCSQSPQSIQYACFAPSWVVGSSAMVVAMMINTFFKLFCLLFSRGGGEC